MNIIIEKSNNSPLDLKLLKSHLRIEHEFEDEYLNTVIDISTEILEKNIEKSIIKKKYAYTLTQSEFSPTKKIEIPIDPVSEIISVKKITGGLNKSKINFSTQIERKKTYVIISETTHPIEIEYYSGIADCNSKIPNDLKYAILQIAKNIYDGLDENILDSPYIKHIIKTHKHLSIN